MGMMKHYLGGLYDAAVAGDEAARRTLLEAGLADEMTAAVWEGREPLLPLAEMEEAAQVEEWWALCFLNEPPPEAVC